MQTPTDHSANTTNGKLRGKVAVVTGASKGIGAAIARHFGAAGAAVIVNYAKDKEGADRVVDAVGKAGSRAVAVQADVSRAADVARLFAEAARAFGPVDVLVNNAGVYAFGPLEAGTEEEFHRQFNANVLGTFLTTQAAVAQMPAAGGSVINLATAGVRSNAAYTSLYTATKAAVVALTKTLAKELGGRRVRVNALAPGLTETEGVRALGFLGSGADAAMVAQTPLGRIGRPEDIAPVAVFLASEDAAWVTGELLLASGGLG